ncbi:hypothetical protein Agub_g11595, partial [Astrephomene gubernaculifera]
GPAQPLVPELLAGLRQVNARFLWLDPSGDGEGSHKQRMEAAVEAATAAVTASAGGRVAEAAGDLAPAEVQLAMLLSSHWRLDSAAASSCLAPNPTLGLPWRPVAWLPVRHKRITLEFMVCSMVLPPAPTAATQPAAAPGAASGKSGAAGEAVSGLRSYARFKEFETSPWFWHVWSETLGLGFLYYLNRIPTQPLLCLPSIKINAEPHKAAVAAKAAPAGAIKGAWQKRGGGPGAQHPNARPPMAPPAMPVRGPCGSRPGAAGRTVPLAASAQVNVPAGGRMPLKAGGHKPGGVPGGRPLGAGGGPGGVSRPTGHGVGKG